MLGQHFLLGAFYKDNRYSLDEGKESARLEVSSASLQGRFLFVPPTSGGVVPFVGVSLEGSDALATTISPGSPIKYTDKGTLVDVAPSIGVMIPVANVGYIEPSVAISVARDHRR